MAPGFATDTPDLQPARVDPDTRRDGMVHVVLTHAGHHLALVADPVRGTRRLTSVPGLPTADGVFRRVPMSHGRVALMSLDCCFLTVHEDDSLSYGVWAEEEFGPAATFEEVLFPGGEVSLRCHTLTFLGVTPTGRVSANRTTTGPSERFFVTPAPAPLVPLAAQPEPEIARVMNLPRQVEREQDPSVPGGPSGSSGPGVPEQPDRSAPADRSL